MDSEDEQDLIVGGKSRKSHGKGVRALTCAAFIIGLQQHCRTKRLPHPSLVVLDSPLVAYQEPDKIEGEAELLRRAGVKDAFDSALSALNAGTQVIIFENEDPPSRVSGKLTAVHFTKSDAGRYGFFPEPAAIVETLWKEHTRTQVRGVTQSMIFDGERQVIHLTRPSDETS